MSDETRKFYKTVFTATVLSEEPIPDDIELSDALAEAVDGSYSAKVDRGEAQEMDAAAVSKELLAQDSDPSFFGIGQDEEDTAT